MSTKTNSRLNRRALFDLQSRALRYFLDNQLEHGLVLDRQRNHDPLDMNGLCSTSATGMGLIAIALASTPEYGLISRKEAIRRVAKGLEAAWTLPSRDGVMPHFTRADGLTTVGSDRLATIDSTWLVAGALLATRFPWLHEHRASALALFERVQWQRWTVREHYDRLLEDPSANKEQLTSRRNDEWLLHGSKDDGRYIPWHWDLLNAETAFMYVLASGSDETGLSTEIWERLCQVRKEQAKLVNELGLFTHQYSLEILNFSRISLPGGLNLQAECRRGVLKNYRTCRAAGNRFKTYAKFWGMSAGDGPPDRPGEPDPYRVYEPLEPPPFDGTAHLMATLASVRLVPELVQSNIRAAVSVPRMLGRYGYSNVNIDRNWVSRDVVGIDVGAAVMAIDNYLHGNRLPRMFHCVPPVKRAIARLKKFS